MSNLPLKVFSDGGDITSLGTLFHDRQLEVTVTDI